MALLVSPANYIGDRVRRAHACVLDGGVAVMAADGDLLLQLRQGQLGVPDAAGDQLPALHRALEHRTKKRLVSAREPGEKSSAGARNNEFESDFNG